MVGTTRCGSAQAVVVSPRANVVTVQSGHLIANSGSTSYLQTAGKLYEIIANTQEVKTALAAAGNDAQFAKVEGVVKKKAGGRVVIEATSISGQKAMTALEGDGNVRFPRCGDLTIKDGDKYVPMKPMTEDAKNRFNSARGSGKFLIGTNFLGLKEDGVLQVWDVITPMRILPMPHPLPGVQPTATDSFV